MNRCTIRLKDGTARCTQLDGNVVVERLAAYEDTGLTPEVCAEYKKFEDEVVARGGMTFGEWAALMHAEKARKAND